MIRPLSYPTFGRRYTYFPSKRLGKTGVGHPYYRYLYSRFNISNVKNGLPIGVKTAILTFQMLIFGPSPCITLFLY